MTPQERYRLSRRTFCRGGTIALAAAATGLANPADALAAQIDRIPEARLGLMTDIHHADKAPAGSRHYRESLAKVAEAVEHFNTSRCDAVIELGDLIDSADSLDKEIEHLRQVDRAYAKVRCRRHYVLGNHCVHTLRKQEFFDNSAAFAGHYSFDLARFHVVVLDACYNSDMQAYERGNFSWQDANIPPGELSWLEADLGATNRNTIVFVHQRLDVATAHGVRNAAEVRAVLERSGKVLAVFQGHNHINDLKQITGIDYITLAAVIEGSGAENNAYCLLDVFEDGSLRIIGQRQQKSYEL